MRRAIEVSVVLAALLACGSKPSAMSVCRKLETAGVAQHCRAAAPGGIGSAAKAHVDFDLAGEPGRQGQVLTFDRATFYDSTVKTFGAMATLAGRYQYGNRSKLVFVQLNAQAGERLGSKTRSVVDAL